MIVDWISDIGEEIGYSRETNHVAFSYLDVLLQNWDVPKSRYELVGATCLLLAGKFLEKEG
jgi:hypothetical protein